MPSEKPSKYVSISNFDLKTSWFHKIAYGSVVFGGAGYYALNEEHNKGWLLASVMFLPFFLGTIKGVRRHFRGILGDDKESNHIEIHDPIDKD